MASHKRSALRKQRDSFVAEFGDMDNLFYAEERRRETLKQERASARQHKACGSKNRYATRAEAQDAIASCAAYGRTGLHCYRCSYCNGWHLTSHPQSQ